MMRGIININKPAGLSSYDVIRQLKPRLKPKRIGHAGTLDLIATGVLLVLLNEATKISRLLLSLPKEYEAELTLGIATETDDITGKIISTAPMPDITPEAFTTLLKERFTGTIMQIPPRFSALKKEGRPLYRLARRGAEFTPPARKVTVYEAELLDWQPPRARLRLVVSSGTYVRALCRDIGQALGSAATMSALTRKRIGKFTITESIPPERLDNPDTDWHQIIVPIDEVLDFLPHITITESEAKALLAGRPATQRSQVSVTATTLATTYLARTADNRFLALVRCYHQGLKPERIIYAD